MSRREIRMERKESRRKKLQENALADLEREYASDPAKLALAQHMLDAGLPFAESIESDYTDRKALKARKKQERERLYKHLESNKGTAKQFMFGALGTAAFYFIAKQVAWYVAKVIIEWMLFGDDDD